MSTSEIGRMERVKIAGALSKEFKLWNEENDREIFRQDKAISCVEKCVRIIALFTTLANSSSEKRKVSSVFSVVLFTLSSAKK